MKRKLLSLTALACAGICAFSMVACDDTAGSSKQFGRPVEFEEDVPENISAFRSKADAFASSFAANAYASYEGEDNFTVSPISVYSALALAAECAAGDTRTEILSALGVTYEQLNANYSALYKSLNVTNGYEGKITNMLSLGNSVWLDEGLDYKQSCIDALSSHYQSYTYSADFYGDNAAANLAVRNFVKEQTKGLIDQDFKLSVDTIFLLVNTLYLKTVWGTGGNDLPYTADTYDFKNSDGTTIKTKLLEGYYRTGRVYESEKFSSFFTTAEGGYKLKFILPKDGYSLSDVFTEETLAEANAVVDYLGIENGDDFENATEYLTRCLFPEFGCKYNARLDDILKEKYGVKLLFDKEKCDFSTMTDTPSFCSKIQHVTDLKVNKTGIEGAAVTIVASEATSAPPQKRVYADFVLDRAFGFVITDRDDVQLFTGAVNKL